MGSREYLPRHLPSFLLPPSPLIKQYYAQQGYTQDQIATMMASWGAADDSSNAEASSSTTYDPKMYDKDGYRIGSVGSGATAPTTVPVLGEEKKKPKKASEQKAPSHGKAPKQKAQMVNKQRDTVIRTAGGRTWEDPTLVDWDPSGCMHVTALTSQSGTACLWVTCPTT